MYAEHQNEIAHYAWQSPQGLADVMIFARLTVQRKLNKVQGMVEAVREFGIDAIPDRQGRRCYKAIAFAAPMLYHQTTGGNPDRVFREVLSLPGFGMAKAGFVTQMLCGDIGCLDRHNLRRFGLKASSFRLGGNWVGVERRIRLYKSICRELGSVYLWNSWCEHIAGLYPKIYTDADMVSALHVEGIIR